jgi:hypothetical protein
VKLKTYLIKKLKDDEEFMLMSLASFYIHKEELLSKKANQEYEEIIKELKKELNSEVQDTELIDKRFSLDTSK